MRITVLKDTIAAETIAGISSKKYEAGQTYEIFDQLASTFIAQGWGEKAEEKAEEKSLKVKLENKAITKTEEDKKVAKKKTNTKKKTKK